MGPLHRAALTSRKAASSNLISNGRFQSSAGGVCAVRAQLLSRVWLFATLWTRARQAPLSMGFSRQEYWGGLPCSPPRDLPNPGMEPTSLMSPSLAGGCFATSATWEALQVRVAINCVTHTHTDTRTRMPQRALLSIYLSKLPLMLEAAPPWKSHLFSLPQTSFCTSLPAVPLISPVLPSSSFSIAVPLPCCKSTCSDISCLGQSKRSIYDRWRKREKERKKRRKRKEKELQLDQDHCQKLTL